MPPLAVSVAPEVFSPTLMISAEMVAVAEPTSMTWLSLSVAVSEAGGQLALLGSRHSARLRGAIVGKNKADVIDARRLNLRSITPLLSERPPE